MYQYPKQILTIEEQIQSYINSGMEFDSIDTVEKALKTVGYYRLRGYSFHLYDNSAKKYVKGTKFENILKVYYFDQELSHIIFSMISKIEVALRVRLVDALLIHKDALILKDSSVFKDKKIYWQNMNIISSEISRSSDVFIKHNLEKYEGEVPIWAVVEVISFGTLSKLIKNLKAGKGSAYSIFADNYKYISEKNKFARPNQDMLTSWLESVSILRNICAHNSRIYMRVITKIPQLINVDRLSPNPKHNKLYQVLLAMKYLRPTDDEWIRFVDKLDDLILKNSDVIILRDMNFPDDWKERLLYKIK